MGDLTEDKMEVDEKEDDKILKRLLQLGEYKDKDGVRQLFIKSDDDSVIALAEIWSDFRRLLESHQIQNESQVLQILLRYTAWIIFDGRYTKYVTSATKSKLTDSFKSIKASETPAGNASLGRVCESLIPLSEAPWTVGVFTDVTKDEINKEAVDKLWHSEGWVLLETRIETMGRIKKLPQINIMGRLLYVCASKGNKWTETEALSESEPVSSTFDAFTYPESEFCDLLEACIYFCAKTVDIVIHIQFLSTLPIQIILKSLKRLNEKSSSAVQCRLLPRLWKKENITLLVVQFVNNLVPAVLRNHHELSHISDLYEFWLHVNLTSAPEEEYSNKVKSLVDAASVAFESVYSTSYIYCMASFILNKLKDGHATAAREIYVELFLRAVIIDINLIDKSRTEIPVDPAKVKSLCEGLAIRLLELSHYFSENQGTSRNLMITSFSLKPSKALFDQLFPSDSSEPSDLCDIEEDLHLPEYLCNDLSTVIFKPRWSALGRHVKGDQLRDTCKKLLEEDFSWLSTGRKNAELKYVNVNYSEYSHLPSKYDPNDDGIEKGFTLSGKRKAKMDFVGRRRIPGINGTAGRTSKLNAIKGSLNSVIHGRGGRVPANWIAKPGGVKKVAHKGCHKNNQQKSTGTIKGKAQSDQAVIKVPKIKSGKKSKSHEIDEKLKKVSQYLRQTENVTMFLEGTTTKLPKAVVSSKLKRLKDQYKQAFLTEEKNIPGHGEIVPYPNAYKKKARGNYLESSRTKPTGYICPPTPFQLKVHGGEFDIEFRMSREVVSDKVIDVYKSRFSKQQQYVRPSSCDNILPLPDKSNYARWSMCGDDFNVDLVCSDDKTLSSSEIVAEQRKARTRLNKDPQLETSELIRLQQEYNKCKEDYSKLPAESSEGPRCQNAFKFMLVPESSQKLPESRELNTEEDEIETASPKLVPVVTNDAYTVGDIVECKTSRSIITVPPGPKRQQEQVRLSMMLADTCKRVANNLECETYTYPIVQKEFRPDQGLTRSLNTKSGNENLRRKRPCPIYAYKPLDDYELLHAVDSVADVHSSHAHPNEFSSRGRRRKQVCSSSCCADSKKIQAESVASNALEGKLKNKRYGKSYDKQSSLAVKRRRAQTQDVSTDASNASDVNNKIAKSKNDTPVDPNVALIKSSYVVPKGASQFDEILRKVTTAEFIEALENLSEPEDGSPTKGNTFGDRFALDVWKQYSQGKNITQIQQELKCSWNPVNKRINDKCYVDKVVQILHKCSPTFRQTFEERSRLDEPLKSPEPSEDVSEKNPGNLDGANSLNETKIGYSESDQQVSTKPNFQVFFPILHNPSIRKTIQLVAKAPIEFPKAPMVEKQVLNEQSGEFTTVLVPAVGEDEEDPNIKAALLIPWPEEKDSNKEDDDHIRLLEDEHFKLLDEKPSYDYGSEERPETPSVSTTRGMASADNETQKGGTYHGEPKDANDDTKSEPQIISVPIAPTPGSNNAAESASEPDPSLSLKRQAGKARPSALRKRKPPDSPETYSEDSSSSTNSSYIGSSSSYEEEKPKPRCHRVLRKRTNQPEENAENLVTTSSPPPAEAVHCPETVKRRRLTDECKTKKVSIMLDCMSREEVNKYMKPVDKVEPSPSPSTRRISKRKKLKKAMFKTIICEEKPGTDSNGISHSTINGTSDNSMPSISVPTINPIEVNISKKKLPKVLLQSVKPLALPKDPLRSSPTERVIEEIQLSSDDEVVEVSSVPCNRTNDLSLQTNNSTEIIEINMREGQEDHHQEDNGHPEMNGYSHQMCEFDMTVEPSDIIMIDENSHPIQDYVPDNVNDIQEEYLSHNENNVEQEYFPDNQEDYLPHNENTISNNLVSPVGQAGSPETILGLVDEDSAISYNDHASGQNFHVETINNNNTKTRTPDFQAELSHLEYDEPSNEQYEQYQNDSDSSDILPPPYSPISETAAQEISDVTNLGEPTPPLLTPEYDESPEERIENTEEISELASPPRLQKYDVVDTGI